jgi:hypothetical protein
MVTDREYVLTLSQFLDSLNDPLSWIDFSDSITLIDSLYEFTPTGFRNGQAVSSPEQNHGSCKILTFSQLQGFNEHQTLLCFGDFYKAVAKSPDGDDHQNIREFIACGWSGVVFDGLALTPIKSAPFATEVN